MFCPKCQSEHEAGLSECPDCKVPLADEPLPPERMNGVSGPEDDLVTVATFDLAFEAERARSMLDSEGVLAFVLDSGLIGVNPTLTWAVGGVKLQVPMSQAEHALGILRSTGCLPERNQPRINSCPSCGSTKIKRHGLTRLEVVLSVLVFGALLLFLKREHICSDCGHTWRA